ncbi:monocarboxylate uptake permease MctP [Metallibacterium scheffleri]|jgi:SSS family solute:Na+ symporter
MRWSALGVFLVLFVLVTALGFFAARWRRADLSQLHEWGLGGRRFGTVITWFLLGGDLYTAYTFIAVPALVFGAGAMGFFALPYTVIAYPLVFMVLPRLWRVAHKHNFITGADFVRGRYGSPTLALLVALTGILATMPYIALQLVGMEVVIAALGFPMGGLLGDLPLIVAFVVLAAYTYTSGLRAPAMIALVKDALVYLTVITLVIVVPWRLGGFAPIFAAVPPAKLLLATPPAHSLGSYSAFASLALGSALALFCYPHVMTGVLASRNPRTLTRNMALLPAFSLALGLLALLGYMALASGVDTLPEFAPYFARFKASFAVPALILHSLPGWFAGVALAAIAIGALVPAAIMSIAAANLWTRNIYREYLNPECSAAQESGQAKAASLVVKFGALLFVLLLPSSYAINFQLLGGVWIIQILPALLFGLYTRWLHRGALIAGWATGMLVGTLMALDLHFASAVFPLRAFGWTVPGYAALYALLANIAVALLATPLLRALRVADGTDHTRREDYLPASE